MRDLLSWSFPIGQLFNITVRVHLILPIVLIGMIGREYVKGDVENRWLDAAMLMGLMFVSVLLHEFGHCFAARYVDGEADEIVLWPLGGLAFCRSLPPSPLAHFIVAAGGPLVNLVLCIICAGLLGLAMDRHYLPPLSPFWYPYRWDASGAMELSLWSGREMVNEWFPILLARLFWVNWVLLLFNLLLVGHPFDAGRMLQAALWPRMGLYQSSRVAIYFGYGVMCIVGLASIICSEPLLAFLTMFIFVACAVEMMTIETAQEDLLFGYDFSQGYTSLEKDEPPKPKAKKQNFLQRWMAERAAKRAQQEQEQRIADDKRMDELLEKIQRYGKDSLTDEEQRFLKRVSERYKK